MRNRNSANLNKQNDSSMDSSSPQPSVGSQKESTDGSPMGTKRKRGDVGITIMIGFFAIILLAGIGLLLYPTFADWYNKQLSAKALTTYTNTVSEMNSEEKEQVLQQAREYNEKLNTMPNRWHFTDEQMEEYNNTLDVSGTGIMGYITIPSIELRLPVYHGTEETVLQIAGGHLAGSSLPIGGNGTHAAVSGHTGLPSAKLFTGLDSLKEGDTFAFHVLDDTYTYQVDQIRTVLPTEMRDLDFDANADYATLITCTPYGVNTHRLLVRGHRIPNPVEPDTTNYDKADRDQTIVVIIAAILILLFIAWIISVIVRRSRRSGRAGISARTQVKHAGK